MQCMLSNIPRALLKMNSYGWSMETLVTATAANHMHQMMSRQRDRSWQSFNATWRSTARQASSTARAAAGGRCRARPQQPATRDAC